MNFDLTPAQEAFRRDTEAFARERVAPSARDIDESNAFPVSLIWEAASRGLLGITIPVFYAWDLFVEGFAAYLGWWSYTDGWGPALDTDRGSFPLRD